MNYQSLLNDYRWKNKRSKILLRDNHRCRNCNRNWGLQVHHKQYNRGENGEFVMPWDYGDKFLITLCADCHDAGHSRYKVPVFKIHKSKKNINSKSKKRWFTSSQN